MGDPKVDIDVSDAPVLAKGLLVQLTSYLGHALAVLNSHSISRLVRKSVARKSVARKSVARKSVARKSVARIV